MGLLLKKWHKEVFVSDNSLAFMYGSATSEFRQSKHRISAAGLRLNRFDGLVPWCLDRLDSEMRPTPR